MIDIKGLIDSITTINPTLFGELLDEQLGIRKAYYHIDYEKVLIKGGKFVETVFQILEELHTGKYSPQPNFNSLQSSLLNAPSDRYPGSIRITIPRLAKVVYELRSHRGGAHKSEIDPLYIDATICLNIVNWIISEFVRLYSDKTTDQVESLIKRMVSRSLPFVEEFEDGDVMLLIDPDSCKEECLLLLYHFYPERVSNVKMKGYLDYQSPQNVTTSLGNAEDNKLVHRNDDGNKLTQKGLLYVEKNYGPKLKLNEDN